MKMSRGWWAGGIVVVALLAAGWAEAQSVSTWSHAGTGSWFTPDYWSPSGVPPSTNYADIANAGTVQVDGPGAVAYGVRLAKGTGTGTLVITPAGALDLTTKGKDLLIAESKGSVGQLTVQGGGLICSNLNAWYGVGTITVTAGVVTARNAINLAGKGASPWTVAGTADLNIGGGMVRARYLYTCMENNTTGRVTITDGILSVSELLGIGSGQGACSKAYSLFTQSGGTINAKAITVGYVGDSSKNRLVATGGATTITNTFIIGYRDRQDTQVTLGGTTLWKVGSHVQIANWPACYAQLTLTNSAELNVPVGQVTVGLGSSGNSATGVLVMAGGSLIVTGAVANSTGNIALGRQCRGRMDIRGGLVRASEVRVGCGENPSVTGHGEINVSGGRLETLANKYLYVGYTAAARGLGTVTQTGGMVDVGRVCFGYISGATGTYTMVGGVLKTPMVLRNAGCTGTFNLLGGIFAANEYDLSLGTLTNQGATISPAYTNIGVVKVESGNYIETSPSSAIDVQIGGKVRGTSHDWVDVVGTATLAGSLQVSLGTYDPTNLLPADKFYVVETDAAIQGAFKNVASGGRVLTAEKHTFLVYYGAGVPGGYDSRQVTLTDFRSYRPAGTVVLVH